MGILFGIEAKAMDPVSDDMAAIAAELSPFSDSSSLSTDLMSPSSTCSTMNPITKDDVDSPGRFRAAMAEFWAVHGRH